MGLYCDDDKKPGHITLLQLLRAVFECSKCPITAFPVIDIVVVNMAVAHLM